MMKYVPGNYFKPLIYRMTFFRSLFISIRDNLLNLCSWYWYLEKQLNKFKLKRKIKKKVRKTKTKLKRYKNSSFFSFRVAMPSCFHYFHAIEETSFTRIQIYPTNCWNALCNCERMDGFEQLFQGNLLLLR